MVVVVDVDMVASGDFVTQCLVVGDLIVEACVDNLVLVSFCGAGRIFFLGGELNFFCF